MTDRRALTVLEPRRAALENCSYCPKLCRAACPVSNAEASDTVTPWGKMRATHAVARGAAPLAADFASLAWACTGCFACRERCEHRNPVVETLYEARAEYAARGLAPPASDGVRADFSKRIGEVKRRAAELSREHRLANDAGVVLLLGCDYVRKLPSESGAAIRAAVSLFGPVRISGECCGLPLQAAGDPAAADAARARLLAEASGARRRIALDAGCAHALGEHGFEPFPRAADAALRDRAVAPVLAGAALRYHDPCLLGRGLGEYESPRSLLQRALGRPPGEFSYRREAGRCSGGGGLLPVTRPRTSIAIANERREENERLGGGVIVTACASSLRRFRAAGAEALDLATVVERLIAS